MGEELDATTKSLIITTLITSSLSVLTTMIFFFFYFKFAPIRNNKASQLFLMLATSNLIIWTVTMVNSLNLLVKNETNSTYNASTCAAIGYILHLSGLMGIMSVLLITLLFYICVLSNDYWATKVNHIIIITILTTVGVSVVPFIYKGFGPDGKVMCWIGNVEIKFWGLYFYVIILAFLIIYFVLVCLKTIRKLKISDNEKIRLTRHVVVFPIILFVSALPGMILTFLEIIHSNEKEGPYFIRLMYTLMEPLDGVLNPFAFIFINKKLYHGIKDFFRMKKELNEVNEEFEGPSVLNNLSFSSNY